jgi:pSer/pThr/pTyr-binding forkhead associated (FHA) protein
VVEAPAPAEPAPPAPAAPEPVRSGPGRLEVAGSGRVIALPDVADIRIGRADPKAGISPEVDLTADDFERTVGRRHARLVRRDGKLFAVEDKASANGTFVNDVRIAPLQETEVPDGARLRFGAVEALYKL